MIIVSVVTIRFLMVRHASCFHLNLEYFILSFFFPSEIINSGVEKKIIRISRAKISRVYREFYEDPCIV